jgi:hypothetical protein
MKPNGQSNKFTLYASLFGVATVIGLTSSVFAQNVPAKVVPAEKDCDPSQVSPFKIVAVDSLQTLNQQGLDANAAEHSGGKVFGNGPNITANDGTSRGHDVPDQSVGPKK